MVLKHDQNLSKLRAIHAKQGKLNWIGTRPAHHKEMISLEAAQLIANAGLKGDHIAQHHSKKRQITLMQFEHLAVIAKLIGTKNVAPELLRRNLIITDINVFSLKDQQFLIGECLLEGTGQCHPCSRMEENLGQGGYNSMRGHGGITARVLSEGVIRIGDPVILSG